MVDRMCLKTLLAAFLVSAFALPGYCQTSVNLMMKAIEINVAEVELGKMASAKATHPRVKEFAELMVKDHSDALTKLHELQGDGAMPDVKPNMKHQQQADRLSKLSGADFDREYMKAMVADHQEAVRFLEQQRGRKQTVSAAANVQNMARVAQELLPTVQHHLELAQQILKEIQTGSKVKSQSKR